MPLDLLTLHLPTLNLPQLIGHHSWKCLIIDEGHRLKNMNCRLIRELKLFNACNRLLLTGTPLQVCSLLNGAAN